MTYLSHDAEEVVLDKLKKDSLSIQVDESTDFTNKSYVRFVNGSEIQENFFCFKEVPETSKGQGMLKSLIFISGNKRSVLREL
jgi:hypothetical protein